MKSTLAVLSLFGAAASAAATPSDCNPDFDGKFQLTVAHVIDKRDLFARADCDGPEGANTLVVSLKAGRMTDAQGRIAYIASNNQFQFDNPAQENALSQDGYCVYKNGSVALKGSTTFWNCDSGGFGNLYDIKVAQQCTPVLLSTLPCGGSAGSSGQAGQVGDGQVVATAMVTTTIVKPLSDGQPQVHTTVVPVPMCQIGDGQVQAKTTPCASVPVAKPTGPPIPQLSDGQPQVTAVVTASPVGQQPDGQPTAPAKAPTAAPVSQKPDGQPNAPATVASIAPVSSTTGVATVSGANRLTVGSIAAVIVGLVGAVYCW